jgi:phosphate/sulfate permease
MKDQTEFKAVIAISVLFAFLTAFIGRSAVIGTGFVENVLLVKTFLTSFSIIILSALVINYFRIYREMPTSTSRTLTVFSASLLFYALSASPLVQILAGFQVITVGPFTYLPDLFAGVASVAILYESYR